MANITELASNIWVVEESEVTFLGATMGTRMTVVRLDNNTLWLHSPVQRSQAVADFVTSLGGTVAVMVAPNKYHHLFMQEWRDVYPDAAVYADSEARKKVPHLRDTYVLEDQPPSTYAHDIDQVIFAGNRAFQEAVFFHKASGTVIFTDLFINVEADHQPLLPKLFLQFEGVCAPDGGIPRLQRWFTFNKSFARAAAQKILAWEPSTLMFAHGPAFAQPAMQVLRREFAYLSP